MPMIEITCPDGKFEAYIAHPENVSADNPAPGLLVIQEIFGVNDVMRSICDAYAAKGYVAVCPDLFWRQEPGIQITDKSQAEWDKAFELYQGFNEAKGVDDLVDTLNAMRERPEITDRVGTIGFCLGGKLAYLMGTRSDADCNVSYYGVAIQDAIDEATAITQPMLMHIGEKDKFVSPEARATILDGVSPIKLVEPHVYEGQDHAFARVGGEHYNKEAADLANKRTEDFLKEHLF